jgi:ribose transport system substrate-binding protein
MNRSTRGRSRALVALVCAGALALAACGSDSTAGSTSAAPTTGGGSATTAGGGSVTTAGSGDTSAPAGDILTEATRISDLAKQGLVFAPTDSDVPSTDIVAQTGWLGPDSTPAPPKDVNLQIIICAPGTACETAANYAVEAAKALGWNAEIVPGAGTPESFTQAFDTALSKKPDVIMTMAVPDVLVGASLAKAKEQGVVTISVADAPNASGTDAYDAYVSYRMPLMHQVNAYNIIAETEGKANVILINDSAFPNLVESNKQFQKVMAECADCKVNVVDWQITDALDPVKADSAITAALQANPDATHLVLPYSIGLSSVIEAVRKAGKTDSVKVVTKDGDEIGLQAVASGGAAFDAGVSLEWVAYAGVDEAIRGVSKSGYTPTEKLGLGVHLFTKENTPADGQADYTQFVDFKAKYLSLWGVG